MAERAKGWKEEKVKAIIDMFVNDGVTYGEAGAILKGLEFELGKRKFEEPIKKE